MNSDSMGRSENLVKLAQRLRHNNHNFDVFDGRNNVKDSRIQDSAVEEVTKPSRAAVLICLFEDEKGDLRVILTKRSSTMSSHSGEVALPGGRRDDGDANDVGTALREAHEEIGLDLSIVEVVTILEPFHTKDENRREEEREWMGYKYLLHFFDYGVGNDSYVIWALTAGILIKTASVVYQQAPAFEERRPAFWSRNNQ